MNGSRVGLFANHRRTLEAYMNEARQKMYSIREELQHTALQRRSAMTKIGSTSELPLGRALVATASWDVAETLYVLKSANLHVTVLCPKALLNILGSFYDAWITAKAPEPGESLASAMIRQMASLLAANPEAHDWVLLREDSLLAALRDSDLDLSLKLKLSPLRSALHLDVLHSKRCMAKFLREAGFSCPQSMSCDSFGDIVEASTTIGFPLLVKIEGGSGGVGVFRANSLNELRSLQPAVDEREVLVERFVEGPNMHIEPLFLSGELVAYNYSLTVKTVTPFGASYERRFLPCESIAPTLKRLGQLLRLNCFATISCILDKDGITHHLYEVDLRPNAWVSYGELVGADFSEAIRRFASNPGGRMESVLSTSMDRVIPHFERDIAQSLTNRDWRRLLDWVLNRNHCWDAIAFYDRKLVRQILWNQFKALLRRAARPLRPLRRRFWPQV